MKIPQSLLFTLPLLQPTSALVGISWSVSDAPSSGLKELTFPMNIADAPHESGFYFAQQFNFVGQSDVGYTGLQPREDSNSKPVLHAAFSSFIAGTKSSDENCSDGADGGSGVSCAVDIEGAYAHTYLLHINNTVGTTWVGTLVDSVSGSETRIGSYELPAGSEGIKGSQMGFVEYYPWNAQASHQCSELPKTAVTFGKPVAEGYVGELEKAYEYGDCVGKAGFETHYTTDGVETSVGF
ncbi:hypothetical protein N7452_007140 [Penicillium brevicompactum]|uniref:Uncharacterized protein n=1 Tax=Penicillium brevicompactum TaxID=5074 RepID=A0A9W9UEH4_PENBR|nr:hypothetical protein N7452_007140 [Penicillium brevicompactum]